MYFGEPMGIVADTCVYREYCLTTEGETEEECIANAWISYLDQDGGDHEGCRLINYGDDVYETALKMIRQGLAEAA